MLKKTLTAFAFAALLMMHYSCSMGTDAGYANISPKDAREMMHSGDKNLLILDVRTKGEYYGPEGHIKGARLIPINLIQNMLGEIETYRNQPVIVYCAVGGRSSKVSSFLNEQGFTKVYNMSGGIMKWNRLGYEVEK